LEDLKTSNKAQAFIFTGYKPDNINEGNDKHWLFKQGKNIFDSYGDPKAYELPEFNFVNRVRLQSWGTNVCGPYCLAFSWYINKEAKSLENIQEQFEDFYQLTKDHLKNDETIRKWYDQKK